MGKYDDQSEERSPSNAANPMGSGVSAGMPVVDGRVEDFFSQGATSSDTFVFYLLSMPFLFNSMSLHFIIGSYCY